ncbi:DUF1054 family protein [Lacticigenium naphthae]|uniref:DUF1054 family protein n=1 Tax=Lacticigenium naphthae TaxID=515351 RepID=UPI000403DDA7|nr:DUF1054 family protein [Lacticigenium naphthae]
MFNKCDFNIFQVNTLDDRMQAIREIIQPTFQEWGEYFVEYFDKNINEKVPYHIAQHKRRTVHPAESTWVGIGGDRRGYKKFPHFQIGINEDHVFIWLALIDNPVNELNMLKYIENHPDTITQLPDDFILSGDHTVSAVKPCTTDNLTTVLSRAKKVKKAEFLVGRIISNNSYLLSDPIEQKKYIKDTVEYLLPLFQDLVELQKKE